MLLAQQALGTLPNPHGGGAWNTQENQAQLGQPAPCSQATPLSQPGVGTCSWLFNPELHAGHLITHSCAAAGQHGR